MRANRPEYRSIASKPLALVIYSQTRGAVGVFLVFTNRESCAGNRANLRKHADQPPQSQSTAVVLAG